MDMHMFLNEEAMLWLRSEERLHTYIPVGGRCPSGVLFSAEI